MLKKIACIFLIGLILGSGTLLADEADKEKAAIASAMQWLKLVDQSKYADSWQQASDYFKQAVTEEDWIQTLQAVRKPLGELISRDLNGASYATSLPGAPDGQYFVIDFTSSFTHKESGIEKVTVKMDQDGTWKIAGYYLLN